MEMVENMKRKESLKSKLGGNQFAPKIECEDKKKIKMIMIIFIKKKIIFSEMKKFQQWIVGRNIKWARNVNGFGLLNMQLSLI